MRLVKINRSLTSHQILHRREAGAHTYHHYWREPRGVKLLLGAVRAVFNYALSPR